MRGRGGLQLASAFGTSIDDPDQPAGRQQLIDTSSHVLFAHWTFLLRRLAERRFFPPAPVFSPGGGCAGGMRQMAGGAGCPRGSQEIRLNATRRRVYSGGRSTGRGAATRGARARASAVAFHRQNVWGQGKPARLVDIVFFVKNHCCPVRMTVRCTCADDCAPVRMTVRSSSRAGLLLVCCNHFRFRIHFTRATKSQS